MSELLCAKQAVASIMPFPRLIVLNAPHARETARCSICCTHATSLVAQYLITHRRTSTVTVGPKDE